MFLGLATRYQQLPVDMVALASRLGLAQYSPKLTDSGLTFVGIKEVSLCVEGVR